MNEICFFGILLIACLFLSIVGCCKKPAPIIEKPIEPTEQKKMDWVVVKSEEKEVDLFTYDISIYQKSGNIIKCQYTDALTSQRYRENLSYGSGLPDRYEQISLDGVIDHVYRIKNGYLNPTTVDGVTVVIYHDTIDRIEYKKTDAPPVKGTSILKVSSYKEVT